MLDKFGARIVVATVLLALTIGWWLITPPEAEPLTDPACMYFHSFKNGPILITQCRWADGRYEETITPE